MKVIVRKWLLTLSAAMLTTLAQGQTTGSAAVSANNGSEVKLHKVVYYKIRESDNVEYAATTALSEIAEFMKRYDNATLTITGYADRGTGNPQLNVMYAQRRATTFRNDLITRYGIDASRIKADSRGDVEQPFAQNDQNRCVVIDAIGYEKVAEEKPLTATELADQQRAQAQAEKERHYQEEMARRATRVDTVYVIQTDTVWMTTDVIEPETPFGLSKANRWNNWFVQAGVGPAIFQGDHNEDAKYGDRIYTAMNFSLGKWIYPALGFRAGFDLDMVRMMYNGAPTYHFDGNYTKRPWLNKMAFNAWNFRLDAMLNLTSLFLRPYQKRIVNIVPYAGIGMIHVWDEPDMNSLSLNLGAMVAVRLSERFDLNFDFRVKEFDDDLNWYKQGHKRDGITNLTVGLTWHFTKRGF